MSMIMLDNWTLATACEQLSMNAEPVHEDISKLCMANLLMGIVLWDEIKRTPNSDTENSINLLHENKTTIQLLSLFDRVDIPNVSDFKPTSEKDYSKNKYAFPQITYGFRDDFYERGKKYFNLCNELGINYLPHPDRSEYFLEQNSFDVEFDRSMLIEQVDKYLIDYYEEINKKYHRNLLHCSYPVLYDYIRQKAGSGCPVDELEVTLELRNDRDVIALRKSLNQIEVAFNKGDITAVDIAIKQIDALSKSITNKYPKETKESQLTIGLSPSLNIPIKYPKLEKRVLNLTFLTRLLDFGIKERLTKENRLRQRQQY